MDAPSPREICANIHQIGSLPQSLAAVLKVLDDPRTAADGIAEVIARDVSLTSRVLKMVNSSHYGQRRRITRVSDAVVVMGLNSVRMLVLSSTVFSLLPDRELAGKFDIRRIWRHLIETATSAERIAEEINYPDPEEAFIAGILHDIGLIIMVLHFREKYLEIIDRLNQGRQGIESAEYDLFGVTHTEVGAEMASLWKLPATLVDIIGNHHNLDNLRLRDDKKVLGDIIALADRFTLGPFAHYFPAIEESIEFFKRVRERLNLDSTTTTEIRKEAIGRAIRLADYLELDIGDTAAILTEANEKLAEMYFSLESMYLQNKEAMRV